jgi:hypothetical protein
MAYIYNEGAQVVAIEAAILFDMNGHLLGITHAPGDSAITFHNTGVYLVHWIISGIEPNQFGLFINDQEVFGTVYGSGSSNQQNSGQSILTVTAGDVLTLRNYSSATAVTLQQVIGGTQRTVNASILISR